MSYRYKVTLAGIKGFFRIYLVSGDNTLYSFHKQMRADMAFAPDQLILFKALDADGAVVARYGLFDLGAGTVDDIRIGDTVKNGVASFVYFYDVEFFDRFSEYFGSFGSQPEDEQPSDSETEGGFRHFG